MPTIKKRVLAYETETVVIAWTYKVGDTYHTYEQTVTIPPKHTLEARTQGATMKPSVGRIVHYRLSKEDAEQIMRRRTTKQSIADRMKMVGSDSITAWPQGAQAHIGNEVKEGDTFPMIIVKLWGDTETASVNGQVFLDGNDVLWATSVSVGEGPHTWSWPERVQ